MQSRSQLCSFFQDFIAFFRLGFGASSLIDVGERDDEDARRNDGDHNIRPDGDGESFDFFPHLVDGRVGGVVEVLHDRAARDDFLGRVLRADLPLLVPR